MKKFLSKSHKVVIRQNNLAFSLKSDITTSTMESNKKEPEMFGAGGRALSTVSRNYDLGGKGFLTDTEKQMRGMDSDNVGHLTNAKVSAIVAETLVLREKTNRMKLWLGILGVAVIVLGLSNLGTAFAAAWLAKDTTVDESTGQLMVKDSDTPVTVQSTGQTSNLMLDESKSYGCMDREYAARLWTGVIDGTPSSIIIREPSQQDADVDPTLQAFLALSLTTNGATWSETMACMPVSGSTSGKKVCIDFTDSRCDADHPGEERALEVIDHHTRRKLFHAATQGHRGLNETEGGGLGGLHVSVNVVQNLPIYLGTAMNYAILAQTGITNTGATFITGDIAVYSLTITSTAITGFALAVDDATGEFSKSVGLVSGKVYAKDYNAPTTEILIAAVGDMQFAYEEAASRTADTTNLSGGLIGGLTLTAGVHTFTSAVNIASTLTFSGSNTDIFIIQIAGALTQAGSTKVILLDGGGVASTPLAKNIYWQVAGAVTIGQAAHMEGILLLKTGITFITGSSLNGRVLAQTACALQSATITQP